MLGAVHVAVVAVYGLVKNLGVDFVGLAEKNLFFGAVMIVKNSPSLTNRLDLWKIRPMDQILGHHLGYLLIWS